MLLDRDNDEVLRTVHYSAIHCPPSTPQQTLSQNPDLNKNKVPQLHAGVAHDTHIKLTKVATEPKSDIQITDDDSPKQY